jgi:membrane protease YdiL (CAAX protease family)
MRTVDLFRFLLYCAAGFTVALLVTMGLTSWGRDCLSLSGLYQAVQWAQTLFLMALPPLAWTRWQVRRPVLATLRLDRVDARSLGLAVCLMVCATPCLEWLAQWNDALPLPEALAGPLRAHQAEAQSAMALMLDNGSGPGAWASLILLVSVATAVGEELMFRGAVLNLCLTSRLGRHAVAVLVGFVFSAIHFDPFGFVPRWVLGTLFVYMVYASGSLWPAILAHACNNLVALIEFKTGWEMTPLLAAHGWLVGLSVVATALLAWRWFRGAGPGGLRP